MLADQLVVMKGGAVMQADVPSAVYRQPADSFVADFLGAANIVPAEVTKPGHITLLGADMPLETGHAVGTGLRAALRAESIRLVQADQARHHPVGTVEFIRDLGASTELVIAVDGARLRVRSDAATGPVPTLAQQVGVVIDASRLSVFAS